MAQRYLRHHCHGHHVVLTVPHQTIRCGVLSREEWLRVATKTTKICAELWKTPFAQLLQKCSDVCHRGHGGASVCVSSIKVHIRIHWTCNQGVRDSNQIMVAYWSVYGDFSPILYIRRDGLWVLYQLASYSMGKGISSTRKKAGA